jgi:RAD54-like protein 2
MSNRDADNDLDLPELQATKRGGGGGGGCVRASTSQQEFYLNDVDTVSSDFNLYSSDRASKTIDLKWALRVFESNYQLNILENGAKMMIAFSLIEGAILNGEKILLFSQSLLTLNMIEQFLAKNYVPNSNEEKWEKYKNYYRIDGSTSGLEREKLINSFNEKNNGLWLFLLSTRAGCLGINLIGANRVIIFDASFNPCHDAQAVCRVYRYGQQKKSYIYRLIADNTMEKKIYDRQINKQNVSDRVVDEIQSENHFTRTEVEKLIHYVKEDAEPADLSNIYSKCNDQVLINTCLKYNNLITKEPFKHESLLLDKKEYQLSNREKRDAFKHYEYEKRMPLNSSKGSSYAASYFAKLNATNRQVFFILL